MIVGGGQGQAEAERREGGKGGAGKQSDCQSKGDAGRMGGEGGDPAVLFPGVVGKLSGVLGGFLARVRPGKDGKEFPGGSLREHVEGHVQ